MNKMSSGNLVLTTIGCGPAIAAKIDRCPCCGVRRVKQYGQARPCFFDRRATGLVKSLFSRVRLAIWVGFAIRPGETRDLTAVDFMKSGAFGKFFL